MSALVTFFIKDDVEYTKSCKISKAIITYCLKNNKGAIFNYLGYSETLVSSIKSNFYFSISDDFLQLNSEFLTTQNIASILSKRGRKSFNKKFAFFDDVFDILQAYGLSNISLCVTKDGSVDSIDDFLEIKKQDKRYVDLLYDDIISRSNIFAYDFTTVIIATN